MKRFKKEEVKSQVVSDFGMTAELYIETGKKPVDEALDYPLLKVYADENSEEKYVEISSNGNLIQIPMEAMKDFLSFSEREVHSETWYEKNIFNQDQ